MRGAMRIFSLMFALLMSLLPVAVVAAESEVAATPTISARLITVQNGVGPGMSVLSAGVHLQLEEGWKTYWRSPGEVGLPPELDWSASDNVANVVMSYPAPTRFTAFDIENFGYSDAVLFPLQVTLTEPGAPVRFAVTLDVLVCAEVCIPETLNLSLDLPLATGLDAGAAELIAEWSAKVPVVGADSGMSIEAAGFVGETLQISARSQVPFTAPDIFPEHGPYAAFGAPEIVLGEGGRSLWAALPVLNAGEGAMQITLTDGARAATLAATFGSAPPRPATQGLWTVLALAVLGGLILNVMPCVLPVLSIKLTSALGAAGKSPARIRAGFLASAAGVMAFFWVLAGILIALKSAGAAIGWGVQFQSPVFLALIIAVLVLFAANLLGWFEITLPQRWATGLAQTEGKGGWLGDFATGAFAAVLATPCSAPFLGTAVTYALSRGGSEIALVFTALGLGLALPYLLIAARPGIVARLPKPGMWMVWVKWAMAGLLGLTALWLLGVLLATSGPMLVTGLVILCLVALVVLVRKVRALVVAPALLVGAAALPVILPASAPISMDAGAWERFERAAIPVRVAAGEVIFVDVTAAWCLTCKANKALVLDRAEVAAALAQITRMQADWTRPDPDIQAYLNDHGRFGIPFNIVYGPGAPDGVALPELLTPQAVLAAISTARANE